MLSGCSAQPAIRSGAQIQTEVLHQLELQHGQAVAPDQGSIWVVFWATWCEPCREEWPDLEIAAQNLSPEGVTIVAINVGESSDQIDQFLDQHTTSFTILRDETGAFAQSWGVYGMPTHVLIDQTGHVVRIVRGPLNEQRVRKIFGFSQSEFSFGHGMDHN